MNFDALLAPIVSFFSEGFGQTIANALRNLFDFFYPANAEAAHPVDLSK